MRSIMLLCTTFLCCSLHAQDSPKTLPPVPNTAEARLMEAGMLMEKDGRQRQAAIGLTLGGAFVGGAIAAVSEGDPDMATPGLAIGGICAVAGIGLNLSAAGKAKRAGALLKAR